MAYRLSRWASPGSATVPGGEELDHPAVPSPRRGDVDDQAGGVPLVGVLRPQLIGQPSGLLGVEAAPMDVDRRPGADPDHEHVALGRHDGVGAGGHMLEHRLGVIAEQVERGGQGVLEQGRHLLQPRISQLGDVDAGRSASGSGAAVWEPSSAWCALLRPSSWTSATSVRIVAQLLGRRSNPASGSTRSGSILDGGLESGDRLDPGTRDSACGVVGSPARRPDRPRSQLTA